MNQIVKIQGNLQKEKSSGTPSKRRERHALRLLIGTTSSEINVDEIYQKLKKVHIFWSSNFISIKLLKIQANFVNEDFKYSDIYNNKNINKLNAKSYGKG